jgi:hypothetical protein
MPEDYMIINAKCKGTGEIAEGSLTKPVDIEIKVYRDKPVVEVKCPYITEDNCRCKSAGSENVKGKNCLYSFNGHFELEDCLT